MFNASLSDRETKMKHYKKIVNWCMIIKNAQNCGEQFEVTLREFKLYLNIDLYYSTAKTQIFLLFETMLMKCRNSSFPFFLKIITRKL